MFIKAMSIGVSHNPGKGKFRPRPQGANGAVNAAFLRAGAFKRFCDRATGLLDRNHAACSRVCLSSAGARTRRPNIMMWERRFGGLAKT
jgi:hypothetical protein